MDAHRCTVDDQLGSRVSRFHNLSFCESEVSALRPPDATSYSVFLIP
jgi:hypothetical protein